MVLILDLDQTLMHASEEGAGERADFRTFGHHVLKRPGLDEFLAFCFECFEVAVWTSATREYAHAMVQGLFQAPHALQFVWSLEQCTRVVDAATGIPYDIKDLTRLVAQEGHSLSHVLAVDDTPRKYERHPENLLPIREWWGDPEDRELLRLMPVLREASTLEDVRTFRTRM